jgi:hypothetical protein
MDSIETRLKEYNQHFENRIIFYDILRKEFIENKSIENLREKNANPE